MSKSWTLDGKVSIVIPCFNHGEMLRETLESVERARNANLAEVIIVNDGSTDPATCAYFEELSHSAYKIIHQENRGLGPARNTGIRASLGEFILPLDSDNYIREPYLSHGVEILTNHPEIGVVYGDAEFFGERTGRWHVREFDLRRLVNENPLDACALYRRTVWSSIDGYDEKMPWMGCEDWDFWMRAALRGWRFEHISEVAFDYRVRRGSMVEGSRIHGRDIQEYIFEKPENSAFRLIRQQEVELSALSGIRDSIDFRIGHQLLAPFRRLWKIVSRKSK